jgi:hypothetical protein
MDDLLHQSRRFVQQAMALLHTILFVDNDESVKWQRAAVSTLTGVVIINWPSYYSTKQSNMYLCGENVVLVSGESLLTSYS